LRLSGSLPAVAEGFGLDKGTLILESKRQIGQRHLETRVTTAAAGLQPLCRWNFQFYFLDGAAPQSAKRSKLHILKLLKRLRQSQGKAKAKHHKHVA
jgi:hypothetical protein